MNVVEDVKESKDKRIDIKQEKTDLYIVSKEKNEAMRKVLAKLSETESGDRMLAYSGIIKLLNHNADAISSLSKMWNEPEEVEDLSAEVYGSVFSRLLEIETKYLDLGTYLTEARKEVLSSLPVMRVTQKLEDTNLNPMFG
jgi:hypothetical protein